MKKTLLVGTMAVFFLLTLPLWNGTNKVLAMAPNVPIQGKLTDAGGNPLNGNYEMKAKIYGDEFVGEALCSDTDTVVVAKGLFAMTLNNCDSNVFGGLNQLYLGIQVGSDPEMTPRQPLYGAPFAHGLVNGVLSSAALTYLFIPGSSFIKEESGDSTRWVLSGGSARIYRGGTLGNKAVRFPVTIPSILYGQPVQVIAITVYYKCQNGASNYIDGTFLLKNTDADSHVSLIADTTNRISFVADSYSINTDNTNNTLSSSQGILALLFDLHFTDDINFIQISGIRLTLDTNF